MGSKKSPDRSRKWLSGDPSAKVMGVRTRSGCQEMWGLFREFMAFSWRQKKYWLLPIVLALFLVGALAVISESTMLSSFIYPFF